MFYIRLCEKISVNSPTVIKFEIIGSSENSAPAFIQYTSNTVICQGTFLQISLIEWSAAERDQADLPRRLSPACPDT